MPNIEADAAVVHAAVKLLKDDKIRADFEVYLKKFLQSLDIILPNQAAHPYRVPAKRFGYILRVAKERYKDDRSNLGDAGEKVKRSDQRASDQSGHQPEDSAGRAAVGGLHQPAEAACGRQRRGQGQRDGACHPQALHGPL